MSYPDAPPPKAVCEARAVITKALDTMCYHDILVLADRIRKANSSIFLSEVKLPSCQ